MDDARHLATIAGIIILSGGPIGFAAAAWERGWIPGTRAWFLRRMVRRVTTRLDSPRIYDQPRTSLRR